MWVKVTNGEVTYITKITETYPTYWFARYVIKENGKDMMTNLRLRYEDWEIAYELSEVEIEGARMLLKRVWGIIDN